ncbi:UDP-N-acetylmuramoyl-tripeptide--D-alanyl-D-alanine ligase [Fodinisporobacter ferrooxydans]|uniref:UDP-N-acetylmuramoyl-tripeptide--D-alanyl-D-alanine ligase n=1 Tax=Fodinisporobacter ferrooxydans TaxID=2901836 RepID=A0ABY4CFH1_9BACL|nr:UDP-N-acetylmuramoyl-tripeptide--D-alanyl-D-alanine ligase [Alicyclobacillaceae bacterium MYW30-H2]
MKRTVAEIVSMTQGALAKGPEDVLVTGVSTDSRNIRPGNLFVPLIGETFDGHQFAEAVAAAGAAAILWTEGRELPTVNCPVIVVADPLLALQQLAHAYRKQLHAKIVAITGSNGKTSTKDIIAKVLSESFRVQKTGGNLNNHIGVPLTLLSLKEDTEIAVVEMGMNHAGEIRLLSQIAEPDVGVITNIGESHLEFFGSRSGIADAKWELIDQLEQLGGQRTAVVNGDEPLLRERAGRFSGRLLFFGIQPGNDVHPVQLQRNGLSGYTFSVGETNRSFQLPVLGEHQVTNALAAIAVAREFGMHDEKIAAGLSRVQLTPMRMQVIQSEQTGWVMVNDAYNASPTSMKAGFQLLGELTDVYKIAALGAMLELGKQSQEAHREVGAAAVQYGIQELYCFGEDARYIVEGALAFGLQKENAHWYKDIESLLTDLRARMLEVKDGVLFVKGSRGMRMERVVQGLE